ncbi:hypothetical protein RHSIM_Rhsim10G0150700 [Rhododendron simsii]|uniref:Uncharacterized protein n=1 Tax=Rhododendron simsii TaxID=118357 RepID=A0A834GIC4_RHOSS|nr:hypothetical protein RHSIM_Rhsim10G0150700 [Rhododendron simsii]
MMFEKGVINCPAHMVGADWTYLCNLWQDKDYKEKCNKYKKQLKDVQDLAMANGSISLTDEELSCTVFGPFSGYIRGLGHGPKPSLTKFGQASRVQLIRDAEKAREEAIAAARTVQVQETGVTCWKLGLIGKSVNQNVGMSPSC